MPRLSISLLGSFQVTADDKPVTGFESAKVRALLAFLAAEASYAHSREALAELLWPDHPPGAALANLRHALANLRKTLADASAQPPFQLITQTTLQFNRSSDASVDLADFSALLAQDESSPPAACRRALALRRGPFLADFRVTGSPQFEEWQVMMAERVDHLSGQALARLVHDCVQAGDFAQATIWTRQQLALQPWNEEMHQQLIWQQARQMLSQALTTSGHSVWESLAAMATMAEVEWAEGDGARTARLLLFVVTHAATATHTRQHAQEILQTMSEPVTPAADEPLLSLEVACQMALRTV